MAAQAGLRVATLATVALASGLALSACGKKTVATSDPAKVCASPETTERIRGLLFSKAATAASSSNRYAIPKLQPQTKVSVVKPLVESVDQATRRTSCTGVLAVSLPAGVMTVGSLRVPIRYSAQPLADGSGLSFDLGGADEVVAAIAGADLTVWASTNAKPEPGLVVEVAPSTGAVTTRVAAAERRRAPSVTTTTEETTAGEMTTVTTPLPRPAAPPRPAPRAPKPAVVAAAPAPSAPPAVPAPVAPKPPRPAVVAAAPIRPKPTPKPVERDEVTTRIAQPERRVRVPPEPPQAPRESRETELARRTPPPLPPLRPAPPLREARVAPPPSAPAPAASADGPVRVFVHVAGAAGRGEADVVRARLGDLILRGAPVATPGVRTVARTPRRNEVRCLKASDCAAARRVGAYLARTLPGGVTVVDMSRTYENDPGVRPGSLELWLKPGATAPGPGDGDDE